MCVGAYVRMLGIYYVCVTVYWAQSMDSCNPWIALHRVRVGFVLCMDNPRDCVSGAAVCCVGGAAVCCVSGAAVCCVSGAAVCCVSGAAVCCVSGAAVCCVSGAAVCCVSGAAVCCVSGAAVTISVLNTHVLNLQRLRVRCYPNTPTVDCRTRHKSTLCTAICKLHKSMLCTNAHALLVCIRTYHA